MMTENNKNHIVNVTLKLLVEKEKLNPSHTPFVTFEAIRREVSSSISASDIRDVLALNFEHYVVERKLVDGRIVPFAHYYLRMESEPIRTNRYEGYTDKSELPFKRGDTVTIKKGTMVKMIGKDPKPAGRTYTVKVHDVCEGSIAYPLHGEMVPAQNPKIVWPGAGGYWCECEVSDLI